MRLLAPELARGLAQTVLAAQSGTYERLCERYLLIDSRSRSERCLNDFICIHYTVVQLEFELKTV